MVDYSKWKDIEISDDEDDVHPNIDTPSLFRWRHQARVERMEEAEKEKQSFNQVKTETLKQVSEIKEKITKGDGDVKKLESSLSELEVKAKKIQEHEAEMKKKEQKTPWNVDTISKPGFAKTVINKEAIRPKYSDMTEDEKEEQMKVFVKENEKKLKQYGMLRKYDDSKKFLLEHHRLVCEDTANYLVIWCIQLEMEQKSELMAHVAHQCICMQYILELSKQLDVDPRSCINSFFTRIQVAELEYKTQFDSEVAGFIQRITKRAEEKTKIAIAEAEEEERQERLGPGGLDPVEVFESLPIELQQCFEERDIPKLQAIIAKLPEEEARHHMKRCVDSGLWVPDASTLKSMEKDEKEEGEATEGGEEEPIYANPASSINDLD